MKTFGEIMRNLRIKKNMELLELSKSVGLSVGKLSEIESDRKDIFTDLHLVHNISLALDDQNEELLSKAIKLKNEGTGFSYSDSGLKTGKSKGWLTLFYEGTCIALISEVEMANRMRKELPKKD